MSPAKLADLPGVPRRRVRTLPAAAMMLDRVLKHLAPEHVVFSALGLREGWIFSQLDAEERYLDPLIEGAQLVGLPLSRVPDFATALVPWTAGLLGDEGTNDKRLRIALCALSDIGWRDHADIPMASLTCTSGRVLCNVFPPGGLAGASLHPAQSTTNDPLSLSLFPGPPPSKPTARARIAADGARGIVQPDRHLPVA